MDKDSFYGISNTRAVSSDATADIRLSSQPTAITEPKSNALRQNTQGENIMAEVDTAMLASQHADIRREAAINAADIRKEGVENTAEVRREVMFEGQEVSNAVKDARHDIITATEASTDRLSLQTNMASDRITDRVVGGIAQLEDRFFTVARDTADLRAQVVETINTVKLATELNALKGIIEGQKNTTYLSDKISSENEKTRDLINDLKYHDLNRGLVERNTALVNAEQDHRHCRDRWLDGRFDQNQAQFAGQWAQLQSQIQAFQSQLQETRQGMVNFGTMAGNAGQQSSTSNNVR